MRKVLLSLLSLTVAGAFASQPTVPEYQHIQEQQTTMKKTGKSEVAGVVFSGDLTVKTASATTATIPYFQDFEGVTPQNPMPEGWSIVDNSTTAAFNMGIGSLQDLPGHSGDYYLISGYDASAVRNAWAFTPGFALTAGTKYYITVYAYVPGFGEDFDEFRITAGTAADQASQTTVIADYTGSKAVSYTAFTKVEAEFVPSANGTYYFAIHHCTAKRDVNAVAFDDFSVTLEPIKEIPSIENMYSVGGLSSFLNDTIYVAPGQNVDFGAETTNVTTYAWSVNGGATPATSADDMYSVAFPANGEYTVALTAGNENGSVDSSLTTTIIKGDVGVEDVVSNKKPNEMITSYTLATNQYVAGINQHYKTIAEKYVLPANVKGEISEMYFYVFKYQFSAANLSQEVNVKVYNEGADGLPGEVIATVPGTMSELFGSQAISNGAIKGFGLNEPIAVQGSFFIVLELPAVAPSASNYIGLVSTVDRGHTDCTSYCYYQNQWLPMSEVLTGGGNMSFLMLPTYKFNGVATGVADTKAENELKPVFAGDLLRTGTQGAVSVAVTDLSGRTVCSAVTVDGTVSVGNLPAGVYIVSVKDGDQVKNVKIVKR